MMKSKRILIITIIVALAFAMAYLLSLSDTREIIVQVKPCEGKKSFPITSFISSANPLVIDTIGFAKANTFCAIADVQSDIANMDSIHVSRREVESFFISVLTDVIHARDSIDINKPDLNQLAYRLQWAEKFQAYGEADKNNNNIFLSVYGYWLDLLSNKLELLSVSDARIKYTHLYRYLANRCNEKRFSVAVKVTNLEKAVDNFVTLNWTHMMGAGWNQASVGFKWSLFLIVVFTCICYCSFFLQILKFLKKNKR